MKKDRNLPSIPNLSRKTAVSAKPKNEFPHISVIEKSVVEKIEGKNPTETRKIVVQTLCEYRTHPSYKLLMQLMISALLRAEREAEREKAPPPLA